MTDQLAKLGLPLISAGAVLCLLYALRRPLARLLSLGGKTALGLAILSLVRALGTAAGLALGANLFNALTLALLGLPGLGLLMLLNWLTQL